MLQKFQSTSEKKLMQIQSQVQTGNFQSEEKDKRDNSLNLPVTFWDFMFLLLGFINCLQCFNVPVTHSFTSPSGHRLPTAQWGGWQEG